MKISYNWLKKYLPAEDLARIGLSDMLSPQEIGRILTQCGLEVSNIEKYQRIKGGLEGLVVGEVLAKQQHPNADRLSLTIVDIGKDPLKIVCGAANVAAGQKVIVATVGSTIYPVNGDEIKIKKSKIRGEESEGMICAEDEIGLGLSHDGILVLPPEAKVGTSAREYFNIEDDWIFEVELTPNRVDAASHAGVARDLLAVLTQEKAETFNVVMPDVSGFISAKKDQPVDILVSDPKACPRYSGVTISDITVSDSPVWLRENLKSVGLKPINNVVDITNYVLHELGQPLHAFDADEISGNKVIVKTLSHGTKFITLDGKERQLHSEDLMICNDKEPMCIAGVFGGIESGVTAKTKKIFLESAKFNPRYIRKTARRHGLHTEASFRFERGSDVDITVYALKRAALLIKELAGGVISSEINDIYPLKIENTEIALNYEYCDRLIGKKIDRQIIKNILLSLQIRILAENEEGLLLSVPPFKVDVQRPADVVEEILRIYGYNKVEIPSQVRVSVSSSPRPDKVKIRNVISELLSSHGFGEIMSNSLTRSSYYEGPAWKKESLISILNPLSSDLDVLRQSLLFSGLEAIAYNLNRQQDSLKIYEFGKTYSRLNQPDKNSENFLEEEQLAVWVCGKSHTGTWREKERSPDIFDLKENVEMILRRLGIRDWVITSSSSLLTDGFIYRNEKGNITYAEGGKVPDEILAKFDIRENVFFVNLKWNSLVQMTGEKITYNGIPRFPSVRRDLAMLLDKSVTYVEIENLAYETERKNLVDVKLFDVFEDEKGLKIPSGKKSYAVSFIFQDEQKTLTDIQVEMMVERLMRIFETRLGAIIRK